LIHDIIGWIGVIFVLIGSIKVASSKEQKADLKVWIFWTTSTIFLITSSLLILAFPQADSYLVMLSANIIGLINNIKGGNKKIGT
jgi:hypothetical protein